MIQVESLIKITDNTGAKIGQVIRVLGGTRRRYAGLGDTVVFSVKSAEPRKQVKKKEVLHGVVVRTKAAYRRKDGSYIRFDENSVVVLSKETKEPRAGRIFGPIPREIAEKGYQKIASLAPEVV